MKLKFFDHLIFNINFVIVLMWYRLLSSCVKLFHAILTI